MVETNAVERQFSRCMIDRRRACTSICTTSALNGNVSSTSVGSVIYSILVRWYSVPMSPRYLHHVTYPTPGTNITNCERVEVSWIVSGTTSATCVLRSMYVVIPRISVQDRGKENGGI